jgi:hypothetical protein
MNREPRRLVLGEGFNIVRSGRVIAFTVASWWGFNVREGAGEASNWRSSRNTAPRLRGASWSAVPAASSRSASRLSTFVSIHESISAVRNKLCYWMLAKPMVSRESRFASSLT